MEHKVLLGMLGIFFIVTILAIGTVYASGVDFSKIFATEKSNPQQLSETLITIERLPIVEEPPLAPTPAPTTPTPPLSSKFETSSLYSLINAHRKENNLSQLRAHISLELSAKRKLEDMNATKYWQHENRDGVISWEVFEQSGYHYSNAGENLSFGNNTAWAVFNAWVNSPQHNQQMLSPDYEDMGAAYDCENYQEAGQKKCAVVLHLGRQQ